MVIKRTTGKEKPRFFCIACIFLLLLSLACNFILGVKSWEKDIVVYVFDGDTISLADGRNVRLLGVDAPETGRCMSGEAKNRLTELSQGRHVRLKNQTKDGYARILADVITDPTFNEWMTYLYHRFIKQDDYQSTAFLNRTMVREGLAKFTSSESDVAELLKRESGVAQAKKSGIYSPSCLQLTPPKSECLVKGNIRNGKRTYHSPGCFNYDQTTIDTSYGDQWFCTEKEAVASGFTKAGGCK